MQSLTTSHAPPSFFALAPVVIPPTTLFTADILAIDLSIVEQVVWLVPIASVFRPSTDFL